jgi:glucose/arabinose dehydrogenase
MPGYALMLSVSLLLTSVGSVPTLSRAQQAAASEPEMKCQPAGSLNRVSGVPEASGLVASRSTPGRLWVHNDSGKPEIFALDADGKVIGTVAVAGATLVDWEAMASAPCGSGSCLYLADIGDNEGNRRNITIYRVPEPTTVSGTARVDAVITATYPDGAHDAETLLASPDGRLYIVTKGDNSDIALYRFPADPKPGATVRLERVGSLSKGKPADNARITDGAISADGTWAVLRTGGALLFYRAADFLNGTFRQSKGVDLSGIGEPQGEAVAFGAGNTVYIAGEGGGKSQPGTLLALTCAGR